MTYDALTPEVRLAGRLQDLDGTFLGTDFHRQAEAILADPQRMVDALVEAGVLTKVPNIAWTNTYAIVQPHVHEWQLVNTSSVAGGRVNCFWLCSCKAQRTTDMYAKAPE